APPHTFVFTHRDLSALHSFPTRRSSDLTTNNKGFIFMTDNSMNRLVCLGWISKPERKENFSFETRVAPLRTQPKLQPRFLTLSQMRLSHNGNLELILRAQRNASHRGGRLRSRLFTKIGIRISLTNLTFELI